MYNIIAHADSNASCVSVPSKYAYEGGQVTEFIYSEPLVITDAVYNVDRKIMTAVCPAIGRVSCVLSYMSKEDGINLCDAVVSASEKGVAIRLGRVPQASRKWFCAIVLADTPVPTEEDSFFPAANSKRPWAN